MRRIYDQKWSYKWRKNVKRENRQRKNENYTLFPAGSIDYCVARVSPRRIASTASPQKLPLLQTRGEMKIEFKVNKRVKGAWNHWLTVATIGKAWLPIAYTKCKLGLRIACSIFLLRLFFIGSQIILQVI